MKSAIWRVILTIVSVTGFGLATRVTNNITSVLLNQVAGNQFQDSDSGWVSAMFSMDVIANAPRVLVFVYLAALIGVLYLIWRRPTKAFAKAYNDGGTVLADRGPPSYPGQVGQGPTRKVNKRTAIALALLGGTALAAAMPGDARAYYNKSDYAEPFIIFPNETGFLIPEIGNTAGNQTSTNSEAYYQANKVMLKRGVIPHGKMPNSGFWADFYVPTSRLVVVNREPFSREWVSSTERGTSKKDEGFHCQTSEGINVTVGMTLAAELSDESAARFLSRFGIKTPAGNRAEPEVIFTSVLYSASLVEVMDGFGRHKVSELVCDQIMAKKLDDVNAQAKAIKDGVSASIVEFFKAYGVNVTFVGWADTFGFDPDVQHVINRRYVASQDQEIAKALGPYTDTITRLAAADALRNFGLKTDGHLPTTVVGQTGGAGGLMESLIAGNLVSKATPAPAPATK